MFIAKENRLAQDVKKTITKNFITKDGTIQINVPEIDKGSVENQREKTNTGK